MARLRRRTARATGRRFHAGKSTGLGRRLGGRRAAHQILQVRDALRGRERGLVEGRLELLLERDHQLDALERAEPQLVDRGSLADGAPGSERRDDRLTGSPAGAPDGKRAGCDPVADLAPLQLSRAVGARQLRSGPDRHAADPLVIEQLLVGVADDRVWVGARLEHQHRVHTLLGAVPHPDDGGLANAGHLFERALDVFGEHVQPLGRDDHLLLAAADEEAPLRIHLADIAGVEPAFVEGLRRGLVRAEISACHVVAAHEDLAVRRDAHLDPGDRLADRSAARAERVVER